MSSTFSRTRALTLSKASRLDLVVMSATSPMLSRVRKTDVSEELAFFRDEVFWDTGARERFERGRSLLQGLS